MAGLTAYEASKTNDGNVKTQAVIKVFEENAPMLRYLTFENIPGDSYTYNVEEKLPGVGYRAYNEGFNKDYGVINPYTERLSIIGTEIDVDTRLIRTRGPQIRAIQEQMSVRSLALKVGADLVNGSSTVDPRQFDGLRVRVGGQNLIPADPAGAGANGPLKLSLLMKAIDETPGANAIIMSKAMRRRIALAAQANLAADVFTTNTDNMGFRVHYFEDIPIIDLGYDDTNNKILDFNEVGPSGGTNSTSVYVVRLGMDGVHGLQNGGISVVDLGEVQDAPVLRTRIDWQLGLAVKSGRAVHRIWGVQDAPVIV